MTILFRIFRLGPVLLLISSTILIGFSAEPEKIALSSALSLQERFAKPGKPFDTPDEAQEFYRLKRAPAGQAIPVERYIAANDQMKLMAQYSSSTNSFAPTLASWTPLGPGNIGGRTRALVVDRLNPTVMYAGGVAGGIWKSTNGGTSWNAKGDLLPNLAVCSLAMDPTNSSVLYAGTGEGFFNSDAVRGAGIMKSTDAGETWSQLNSTDRERFYYVNDIVVAPSGRVYAATRSGVFRSTNGGTTWTKVLDPGVSDGCLDLAIRTGQTNDYLFASCGSFEQATVYRNTNAGGSGTWTAVYTEPAMGRTSLAVAPSNQNVVYGLVTDRGTKGLLAVVRSTDSGSTWASRVRNTDPTKLNTVLLTNPVFAFYADCNFGTNQFFNQGWYDNVVAVDPLDQERVWVGGIDLFRSDDGGANWGMASHWWAPTGHSHLAHADQHVILFHPDYNGGSNKKMYVANDGGIFRTDDARAATATGSTAPCSFDNGSVSWTSLNNGYGVTQFYHGLPYPNGLTYFGGTQDNGTLRGSDSSGINGWSRPLGGDGGSVAVDPTNTNNLYAENTRLSLQKSNDGGASWF
ncbi:MAG TPA: hypothetical protein VK747_23195, partial [Blastocatellia bacterium]|nr:hypothetical protein [Blastocatellia bacterium]